MNEAKKPQAGEWWRTRGGERRYVWAVKPDLLKTAQPVFAADRDTNNRTYTYCADGQYYQGKQSREDLVEHLPWCTSFDDVAPVAETWPKYFEAYDEWNAFVRCERNGSNFAVRRDGTGEVLAMMDYQYFSGRKQLTEAEALARLQPPAPTCPDCSEPFTAGHADVCPMAWVEITDPEHIPRVGIDQWFSETRREWREQLDCHDAVPIKTIPYGISKPLSHRCRRRDLPPLPAPQPSTPDPGDGWRLLERGEVIERGDEWEVNNQGVWINAGLIGNKVDSGHYRRRITPAPCICPQPGVVSLDCPTDGLGHGFSEPDTVPIQFMVPRRVLDGGDWPVRACLAGGLVEDAATWIPVMIDRLGNASVRKAVNQ